MRKVPARSLERGFGVILIFLVVGIAVLGLTGAFWYFQKPKQINLQNSSQESSQPISTSSADQIKSINDRLAQIEPRVKDLPKIQAFDERIASLENQFKQIDTKLKTQTSTKTATAYIPVGSTNDGVGSTGWSSFGQLQAVIDPLDYPGYISMQLLANLRLNAGGKAFARLYNETDGGAVSGSEISTINTVFTPLISSGFSVPAGKKTFRIEGKTETGDQIFIQNVKIKVNF